MTPPSLVNSEYVPIDLARFHFTEALTAAEQEVLARPLPRTLHRIPFIAAPRLLTPLLEIAERSGVSGAPLCQSVALILKKVQETGIPYWRWESSVWITLLNRRHPARMYIAAVAYHVGRFREFGRLQQFRHCGLYAAAIFGPDLFAHELMRLMTILQKLGYETRHFHAFLPSVLGTLMLENGDPRLETFSLELLRSEKGHRSHPTVRAIGKVSNALAALGIIEKPLRMRDYVGWRQKDTTGIDPEWVAWCRRWRETSTMRPKTRETVYSFALRTGLWLAHHHPEVRSPADWTVPLCADFLAALNRITVGEWVLASAPSPRRGQPGQSMAAHSKRGFLHALRRFLIDVELWGWTPLRCRPRHHLATPRSVAFTCPVNPRVIDDAIWLKLIWASLHIERSDLLSEIHYPLALIQAMAVVWTHTGLRQNEIIRLAVGCARAQTDDIVNDDGSRIPAGTLCYLDVPAGKTFRAFVKPVAAVVKDKIDAWQAERPIEQTALLDERTGERVQFLFQFRGRPVGVTLLNKTVIPLLCAKAGVPTRDSHGPITSHRGRASVVTALASVPKGMSLIELMQWSGHSSPTSTMHYIRIRPTKLAASFAQADHMAHMISVLIDHDRATRLAGEPYTFYDLGNSYCTNPFWSSCPHRMACAGCDFNLPKTSARAQSLESKASLKRYLEEVPLSAEERGIVEGDLVKLDGFIQKLAHVPTPDGCTPCEIHSGSNGTADIVPSHDMKVSRH